MRTDDKTPNIPGGNSRPDVVPINQRTADVAQAFESTFAVTLESTLSATVQPILDNQKEMAERLIHTLNRQVDVLAELATLVRILPLKLGEIDAAIERIENAIGGRW